MPMCGETLKGPKDGPFTKEGIARFPDDHPSRWKGVTLADYAEFMGRVASALYAKRAKPAKGKK